MSIPPPADRPVAQYLSTVELAAERDVVLSRIVERLSGDARVEGAWLSGSFGRGEEDPWSDLDLHVAVSDGSFDAFLRERSRLYEAVGDPVLVQYEMPSDSLVDGVFQLVWFAGGVEVDWNIGPASQAIKPQWHRLLFERRPFDVQAPPALSDDERSREAATQLTFFWAMVPLAIKGAARRESGSAAGMIAMLTVAFIRMWRLVHQPDGPSPWLPTLTNRPLEDALQAKIPRLGETVSPDSACDVIEELCHQVELLQPMLAGIGAAIDPRMAAESSSLLLLCRRALMHES